MMVVTLETRTSALAATGWVGSAGCLARGRSWRPSFSVMYPPPPPLLLLLLLLLRVLAVLDSTSALPPVEE